MKKLIISLTMATLLMGSMVSASAAYGQTCSGGTNSSSYSSSYETLKTQVAQYVQNGSAQNSTTCKGNYTSNYSECLTNWSKYISNSGKNTTYTWSSCPSGTKDCTTGNCTNNSGNCTTGNCTNKSNDCTTGSCTNSSVNCKNGNCDDDTCTTGDCADGSDNNTETGTEPGSEPSAPENGSNSGSNSSGTTAVSSYEQQVVTLVNEERAKYGLSALTLNEDLSSVARLKSQDMKDNNYFSHTSPTYGTPFEMMKSFGISYKSAGENIAKGQKTPQEVVTAWMNSEGHRANILSSSYTQIGVGHVSSGNYWTQLFIG